VLRFICWDLDTFYTLVMYQIDNFLREWISIGFSNLTRWLMEITIAEY
jgi:hypothetical protein